MHRQTAMDQVRLLLHNGLAPVPSRQGRQQHQQQQLSCQLSTGLNGCSRVFRRCIQPFSQPPHLAVLCGRRESREQLHLSGSASHVEVRIHESLSRAQLNKPLQFGLYATARHEIGEVVTPYGGCLRHSQDYADKQTIGQDAQLQQLQSASQASGPQSMASASAPSVRVPLTPLAIKTHARRVPGSGHVLDGLPQACMYHRPIPRTLSALNAAVRAGMAPLLPRLSRFTSAQLQLFRDSAFGFMANTARKSECNVSVAYRPVMTGRRGDTKLEVPLLIATRVIKKGEEIKCPYNSIEAKQKLMSKATTAAAGERQPPQTPAVASAAAATLQPRSLLFGCSSRQQALRRQCINLHTFLSEHSAEYALLRYAPWTVDSPAHKPLDVDVRSSSILPSMLGVFLRASTHTASR